MNVQTSGTYPPNIEALCSHKNRNIYPHKYNVNSNPSTAVPLKELSHLTHFKKTKKNTKQGSHSMNLVTLASGRTKKNGERDKMKK